MIKDQQIKGDSFFHKMLGAGVGLGYDGRQHRREGAELPCGKREENKGLLLLVAQVMAYITGLVKLCFTLSIIPAKPPVSTDKMAKGLLGWRGLDQMSSIPFFWGQESKACPYKLFSLAAVCGGLGWSVCTKQAVVEGSLVGWQPCLIHCNLLEKLARRGFPGAAQPIKCSGNIRAYLEEGADSIRERHGWGKYLETGNQKDHNISLCKVNIKPISNAHATLTVLTIGQGVAFIRNDPVAHLHHKPFTRASLLQGCPCQGHARTLDNLYMTSLSISSGMTLLRLWSAITNALIRPFRQGPWHPVPEFLWSSVLCCAGEGCSWSHHPPFQVPGKAVSQEMSAISKTH